MSLFDRTSWQAGVARSGTGHGRRQLRYEQVISLIDRLVAEKRLKPGDKLPTHQELAGMAGVSLITVRRALDELARADRVARHQGVGTFVAHPRIVAEPQRSGGLLATLPEQGEPRTVTTKVIEVRDGPADEAVAHALHAEPGARVWEIVRLRLIDGTPLVVERALVPFALARDLGGHRAEIATSLYGLLAGSYGLVDEYEEQYLEVRAPTAAERRLLALPIRSRVVRLRGVSFTANDVPFDCFEHVYPADEFVFYMSGRTARGLFRTGASGPWGIADDAVGGSATGGAPALQEKRADEGGPGV